MDTLKTVTIYVLLTLCLGGAMWMTHLRFTEVEKARCEAWSWKVCQDLKQ